MPPSRPCPKAAADSSPGVVPLASVAFGYLPILLFLGVALGLSGTFVFLPMLVSRLSGTHKPTAAKLAEYECGFPAFEDSRAQFDVRFYLVAILFIVFDIETVFMIPWGVYYKQLSCAVPMVHNTCPSGQVSFFGLGEMLVFMAILLVGLAYVWKKGALQWD